MRVRLQESEVVSGVPLVLAAMLLAACAKEVAPPAQQPLLLEQQFQAELDALHEEFEFPGATAAYVLPGGASGVAATGFFDVEREQPMTVHSRMLAASIGKSFVGAEVLALSLEGKLDIDDPVSRWLGDLPWYPRLPNADQITVRHLLNHTAGLADHVHNPEFAKSLSQRWREPDPPFSPEALIEFILDQQPLNEPGERLEYTDTGYILLGLIIERAAGRSFYSEVENRFLAPLGLHQTSPSNRRELAGLAAGYTVEGHPLGVPSKSITEPGVMAWNPAIEWTGGGFISHPLDLARWAQALYEGKAMSGDYLTELYRSVPVDPSGNVSYGAGVTIVADTPLGPRYGHGGGIPGYTSSMRYFPRYGFAIAFQVNTDINAGAFARALEERLTQVVADSLTVSDP